jgi:CBS domain-containing protein
MAHVYDILADKGHDVHTVDETVTVLAATQTMNDHKIGALVVMRGKNVAGMFTERDVLQRIVAAQCDPATTRVADGMTRKVMCCSPDTTLDEARSIMRNKRIRHLPVVGKNGELVGMISIGDLNGWCIADGEATIQYMSEYIYGRA